MPAVMIAAERICARFAHTRCWSASPPPLQGGLFFVGTHVFVCRFPRVSLACCARLLHPWLQAFAPLERVGVIAARVIASRVTEPGTIASHVIALLTIGSDAIDSGSIASGANAS
jgi:hypothetical protein